MLDDVKSPKTIVWFYAPFKALDHPNPSGDQTIAKGLVQYLKEEKYEIHTISRLRTRWIYWRPSLWPNLIFEYLRIFMHPKA